MVSTIVIFVVGIVVALMCFVGMYYTVTEEMRKAEDG